MGRAGENAPSAEATRESLMARLCLLAGPGVYTLTLNDPGLDDVERMREYIVDTYLVFNRKTPFFIVC